MYILSECVNLISIDLVVRENYFLSIVGENYFSRFKKLVTFKFQVVRALEMDQKVDYYLDNLLINSLRKL